MASLAAVAAAGVAIAHPAPASAADDYTPQPYDATQIPNAEELHMIRRWTYGYRPAQLAAVRAAGGARAWFEAQLNPAGVAEAPAAAEIDGWWECLSATPEQIVARDADKTETAWEAMDNYARFALAKRMESERQVFELMAEFWEDHLYIPIHDDAVHPFRIGFGLGIRERALTSFEQLLQFATTHPAMACSLDSAASTAKALNENHGRELLELHTVGQGAYTEDDVKESSRLLTGYRVDKWSTWKVYYNATDHYVGSVKVMDFTDPNSAADGRAAVERYLRYLARHPLTAQRIARKLAQRFVRDDPSQGLVDHLASVYLQNNTEVKPVLRALINHPEFWSSTEAKVKTPTDEVVSIFRSLEARLTKPTADRDGAGIIHIVWISQAIGASPWTHPLPDGPPITNDAWTSPSRFLASWKAHWNAATYSWPKKGVDYTVANSDRLPAPGITLAQMVDHLSRTMVGVPSTRELVEACCTATKAPPTTVINPGHYLLAWEFGKILTHVLNQPSFYLR
ncbi:MAG: DUF1800 family protein [Leucobacter sp.]